MEQFKTGDTVEIARNPGIWNSQLGGEYPNRAKYPLTGVITAFNGQTLNVNGYGFDFDTLIEKDIIKLVEMKLETTKEKVLAAAATSDIAKKLLKELHPEAFADEWVRVNRFDPIKKGGVVVIAPAGFDDCDFYVPRGLKIVAHPEHDGYYRIEKR